MQIAYLIQALLNIRVPLPREKHGSLHRPDPSFAMDYQIHILGRKGLIKSVQFLKRASIQLKGGLDFTHYLRNTAKL